MPKAINKEANPMTTKNKSLITFCDCSDPAHSMHFDFLDGNGVEEPELYVAVQLNPLHKWWRRLWIAIRYVQGSRSQYSYGCWDEGCISAESAKLLIPMLRKFLDSHLAWEKSQRLVSTAGTNLTTATAQVLPTWRFDSTY